MCVLRSGGCGVAPVPPGTIFKKRVIVYPEVGNIRQSHLLVCRGIYFFYMLCRFKQWESKVIIDFNLLIKNIILQLKTNCWVTDCTLNNDTLPSHNTIGNTVPIFEYRP